MQDYTKLNKELSKIVSVSDSKIYNSYTNVKDLSFIKLRDILLVTGKIVNENLESNIYVVLIESGFSGKNEATVAIQLKDNCLLFASYADEGVINQHSSKKAVDIVIAKLSSYRDKSVSEIKIPEKPITKNRKYLFWIIPLIIVAIIIGVSNRTIKDETEKNIEADTENTQESELFLQEYAKECERYNNEVSKYNIEVDRFNGLVLKLSEFGIVDLPEVIALKEEKEIDGEKYGESSLETLKSDITIIQNNTTDIINRYVDTAETGYNILVSDYNALAEEYNNSISLTSVDFIEDIPKSVELLRNYSETEGLSSDEDLFLALDKIFEDIKAVGVNYCIVNQITNPTQEWVIGRLNDVSSLRNSQPVTASNDPNGLLGKEGGYTSCVYFTVNQINPNTVNGSSIVDKGTDAGGCIEVYESLENALNRCDYLSQFDGTLLYSGSYAIIGTMVVRTSYKLNDEQQILITNQITQAFTRVE